MNLQENIQLAKYTTLQVGGPARYLVEVTNAKELEQVRQFAEQTGAPVLLLGSGSNVLVPDEGYLGIVVINKLNGVTFESFSKNKVRVTVAAGENLDALVQKTIDQGLWGLENLSHIPGTVGAAPIQNVGAYGVEVSSLIESVTAYSLCTGEQKTFSNEECEFTYRDSYFKTKRGRDWCVTSVAFMLSTERQPVLTYGDLQQLDADSVLLQEIRDTVISIRSGKFPDWHTTGTAGSFFKNPIAPAALAENLKKQYPELPMYEQPDGKVKISLGWILDKVCGLRGVKSGKVGLYEHQALVLINDGDSAADVARFATEVVSMVQDKTGITIEPEVRFV